jgi:hypothetical protein
VNCTGNTASWQQLSVGGIDNSIDIRLVYDISLSHFQG